MRLLDRARLLLCLAALLWPHGGVASAQDKPVDSLRRVLVLHSFGPHFAPWNAIASRMREELIKQSPNPVDLYETALEGDRFGQSRSGRVCRPSARSVRAEAAGLDHCIGRTCSPLRPAEPFEAVRVDATADFKRR